jgi:hypothetical protein
MAHGHSRVYWASCANILHVEFISGPSSSIHRLSLSWTRCAPSCAPSRPPWQAALRALRRRHATTPRRLRR